MLQPEQRSILTDQKVISILNIYFLSDRLLDPRSCGRFRWIEEGIETVKRNLRAIFKHFLVLLTVFCFGGSMASSESPPPEPPPEEPPQETWTAGTSPRIGDIQFQTVATWPQERTRAFLGAGEEVMLSIDPDSWTDKDEKWISQTCGGGSQSQGLFSDAIGEIAWTISWSYETGGSGGTAFSDVDALTVSAARDEGNFLASLRILDSGEKYAPESAEDEVRFWVFLPNSINVSLASNVTNHYPASPGTTHFGAGHNFHLTFGPQNLNFGALRLRERLEPVNHQWPGGITWNIPAGFYPAGDEGVGLFTPGNIMTDQNDDGGARSIDEYLRISSFPAKYNPSFLTTFTPFEYQTDEGSWRDLGLTTSHSWTWGGTTLNFQSYTALGVYHGGIVFSPWMGPWAGP